MQNILKFGLAAFVALFLSSTASAFTLPGASSGGSVNVDELVGRVTASLSVICPL